MDNLSIFADIVNDYLARENMTVNQFAKRIDVAPNAIAKWLKCQYFPTPSCVIKVANLLNCSTDYLLGLSEYSTIASRQSTVDFYKNFVNILSQKHLTAYKVAKYCHIGETAISKWKKGVQPKTETLIALSQCFNCSLDSLIGR